MNAKVHIFQNVCLESRLLEMNRLQIEKINVSPLIRVSWLRCKEKPEKQCCKDANCL